MRAPRHERRFITLLLALAAVACAGGPPPETALSAVTQDGTVVPLDSITTSFQVGGITVIHRPVWANDIVAVNLYLLGGSRQLTRGTAGIETLLLRASGYGTKHYPGDRARRAEGLTGSRIMVRPEGDWTLFSFQGLMTEFDSTWAVFADRLMHPVLETGAVDVARAKMLTAARSGRNSPDALLGRLADSVAFGEHPYSLSPWGTEASLRAITVEDLQRYHAEAMITSRMLLVVVGNVSRQQIEHAVARTLAALPRGEYQWEPPSAWGQPGTVIAVHPRALPTNYIMGYFAGPLPSAADYPAFRLATAMLGARIHARIRAAGISYAAYAPFLDRGAPGGGIYVSTVSPTEAMRMINESIEEMRRSTFTRPSISFFAEQFIMDYFLENATNADQADFLARAQLYRGDWRLASRYMVELRRVSPSAVRAAAVRYMKDIRFAYVGDPRKVPEKEMRRWEGRTEE